MQQSPALAALSALANETRLGIVRHLIVRGGQGHPAGCIARAVNVSASGLSFHLRLLEQAGLVRAERQGRQVIYALDRAHLGAVIGYLLNDCCAGDQEVWACCRNPNADGSPCLSDTDQSTDAPVAVASGTSKI